MDFSQSVKESVTHLPVDYPALLSLFTPYATSRTFSMHINSFNYAAPQIWNAIPLNIRNPPSVGSFKHTFRTFYFAAAF